MGGAPMLYGFAVCSCITASVALVESRLRAAGLISRDLSGRITQGCWNTSVAASAGTHAGGGVLDLTDWTPYRAQLDQIMTSCGWIDFYRPAGVLGAGSIAHHHVVLYGCPHLSAAAQAQVADALAGRNGLANHAADSGPRPTKTWQQAAASFTAAGQPAAGTTKTGADDMGPIFMRTTEPGGPIYMLTPGQPVRHLTPEDWALFVRLGATTPGSDYNRREVDIVNSYLQPAPIVVPANVPDPATLAGQIIAELADKLGDALAADVVAELASQLELHISVKEAQA